MPSSSRTGRLSSHCSPRDGFDKQRYDAEYERIFGERKHIEGGRYVRKATTRAPEVSNVG